MKPNNDAFTPNNLNQYASINGNSMVYDLKGNLTISSYSLCPSIYACDAQNRLIGVTNAANTGNFGYDGLNRCVRRVINGTATYNYYDVWTLVEERDASGTLMASYIQGANMDEEVCRTTWNGSTATRLYYEGDALNSVQRLTDTTGNIVEHYRYDAFGLPSVYDASFSPLTSSSSGNRFMFQGREYFYEFKLTDHRNRYYSPLLQRWLNRDPIEERGSLNLYVFVKNNPIMYFDSYGLKDPNDPCPAGTHCAGSVYQTYVGWHCDGGCVPDGPLPPPITPPITPPPPSTGHTTFHKHDGYCSLACYCRNEFVWQTQTGWGQAALTDATFLSDGCNCNYTESSGSDAGTTHSIPGGYGKICGMCYK